jgi:sulfite reductase alpha subunit-like flavoprotein
MLNRAIHANLGIFTAITLGVIALSCPFIAHKDLLKGGIFEGTGKVLRDIHYGKFLPKDSRWIWINSQGLALFGLVGSGWFLHRRVKKHGSTVAASDPSSPGSSVTVLYASQTGRAEREARAFADAAEAEGMRVFVCPADRYDYSKLKDERWVLCIASTFGKGEPPDNGVPLKAFLDSADGQRFPRLEFAVLGLGDVRFPQFCAFTRYLDQRFEALGAKRMAAPVECGTDEDSQAAAVAWRAGIVSILAARRKMARPEPRKPRSRPTKKDPPDSQIAEGRKLEDSNEKSPAVSAIS